MIELGEHFALWVLAGVFVVGAVGFFVIDTVGRIDLIADRFPWTEGILVKRRSFAALLVIAILLQIGVGYEVVKKEIPESPKPPVFVFLTPSPPTMQQQAPTPKQQIVWSQQPLKPGNASYLVGPSDKPGVLAIITVKRDFDSPAFEAGCSSACTLLSAMSIDTATGFESLPQPNEAAIRMRFTIPGRIRAGGQATLDIRSKTDKPISLLWVRPYSG